MGGGLILEGKPYRGSRRNGAMNFGQLTSSDPAREKYLISGLETDQETVDGYILSAYSGYALSEGELSGAVSAGLGFVLNRVGEKS